MKKFQMTNLHYALFVIIFNFGDVGERNVDSILGTDGCPELLLPQKKVLPASG